MLDFWKDNVEVNIEEPHSFASILATVFCILRYARLGLSLYKECSLELNHNFYEDLQAAWSSSSKLLAPPVVALIAWIVERKFLMEMALKLSAT